MRAEHARMRRPLDIVRDSQQIFPFTEKTGLSGKWFEKIFLTGLCEISIRRILYYERLVRYFRT